MHQPECGMFFTAAAATIVQIVHAAYMGALYVRLTANVEVIALLRVLTTTAMLPESQPLQLLQLLLLLSLLLLKHDITLTDCCCCSWPSQLHSPFHIQHQHQQHSASSHTSVAL
eukprot:13785-Heterococcus_DN1.PRE.2